MTFPLARSAVIKVDKIDVAYFTSLNLAVNDYECLACTDKGRLQMRRTVVQVVGSSVNSLKFEANSRCFGPG